MPTVPRELRLVLTVAEHDAAVALFRDALGLRPEASFEDANGGRATLLQAGRATLEVGDVAHAETIDALEVGDRVAGPLRLAFEVDDADAGARSLVAAGARLVGGPVATPWGSLNARLATPDGTQLTLWSSDPYVAGRPPTGGAVVLAEPDPSWARTAEALVSQVRSTLGAGAVVVAHVGSTSVPGLAAKPVVDLVLGVADPVDEDAYVPGLERLGYVLRIREPEWHEHRLLRHEDPAVNLHVFAAGADEVSRMLAFRDHLRRDVDDRALYLRAKRELAVRTWAKLQDYADAKSDVVEAILRRATADVRPLRGSLVLVAGAGGADAGADTDTEVTARALAERLGLPLLSETAVRTTLVQAGVVDAVTAARTAVTALAGDSGGAVVVGPGPQELTAQAAAHRLRVVEVPLAAAAVQDLDGLARLVRQQAADP